MQADRWRALRAAFDELADQEAGPRSASLAALRAEDAELAREVEELLAAEEVEGPLDLAPDAALAELGVDDGTGREPGAGTGNEPEAGTRVGPWELLDCLGEGGMGSVWRARREAPRRTAALKLMRLAAPGSRALRRFEFEAEVLARLRHPHVAQLFEAGVARGPGGVDLPWMAVELVPGALHLTAYARVRELELPARLVLFLEAADAVAHGHARGVVHRDLKSANVLVDEDGSVKVIDFGIARAVGPDVEVAAEAGLTQAGEILGSLGALAPEQLSGDPADVDTRTDVYALGVLLWELVRGRRPFETAGLSLAEIARRVERDPLPPLAAEFGDDGRRPPSELDWIVRRATEKDPQQRYPGVRELAADLRSLLADEPLAVGPPDLAYRMRLFVKRNRAAVSVAAIVLTILFTAALAIWSSRREQQRALEQSARDHASMQRLADAAGLEELQRRAPELWPALPERVRAIEGWLLEAQALAAGLAQHRAVLQELEARATRTGGADAVGTLQAARDPDRWWMRELRSLVAELEVLASREMPLVQALLVSARSVEERTLTGADAREAWIVARARVSGAARYGGLDLTPQLGLLPLGPDPSSGLEEFAHLLSGPAARRGGGGELEYTPETGVVLVLLPGATVEIEGVEVALAPHFFAKHETTRGQWRRLFAEDPSDYLPPGDAGRHPVERVTWLAAAEAARRLDLELVTEAQWQAAARAAPARSAEEWQRTAWIGAPQVHPRPVGEFPPDPLGLFDLQGNLSEWCRDVYGLPQHGWRRATDDGELLVEGGLDRVVRGAAFSTLLDRVVEWTAPGWRMLDSPGAARESRGVRFSRSLRTRP